MSWDQELKEYSHFKWSDVSVYPLGILLSQHFHWEGLKLHTWNALTVGHPHVSSWAETQVPVGLYPDSRNSSSQQEPTQGHAAWEISFHTRLLFTFDHDKEKLKGFSTASTTAQGVRPMLFPGTRAPATAAGRRQETRPPLLPPRPGRDQSAKELVNVKTSKLGTGVCRCEPQKASHSKPILYLHCVAAGPQEIQSTVKV